MLTHRAWSRAASKRWSLIVFCSFATVAVFLLLNSGWMSSESTSTHLPAFTKARHCMLSDGSWTQITNPDYIPLWWGSLEAAPREPSLRIIHCEQRPPPYPSGTLPPAWQFHRDNGTMWTIEYVGDISFTGELATKNVVGDKCRSSTLGGKTIWNCGDMWCDFDYTICGFAMGPAMYGTDTVMTINTTGITRIYENDFVRPWHGDPQPQGDYKFWGMDTSNVAAVNETHGVAYGFEVWRGGGPDDIRQGNCVAWVTLGDKMPIATRTGPLLTGPEKIEMGMVAILRAGDYIYIYSEGGPSRLLVSRVRANEDVEDLTKYETLKFGYTNKWVSEIPGKFTSEYGMTTLAHAGEFGCAVYGSAFYSNYLHKYVLLCNIYEEATNMFLSDTPYGPWSEEYPILRGWKGYGSMAHPQYSPFGSHKEFYFSIGPNSAFHMFKVSFKYDEQVT